ncbi:MAG: hypothetical protein ACOY93_15225 [Bacillota bacterium]
MAHSPERLAEFGEQFQRMVGMWEEAMGSGDTRGLESDMAEGVVCYFGQAGAGLMTVLDRDGIVAGMRRSVAALQGCSKRFEHVMIRMRSDEEAVVFFEQVVERAGRVLARLFTIETYQRRSSGHWVCVREVVEHTGS